MNDNFKRIDKFMPPFLVFILVVSFIGALQMGTAFWPAAGYTALIGGITAVAWFVPSPAKTDIRSLEMIVHITIWSLCLTLLYLVVRVGAAALQNVSR